MEESYALAIRYTCHMLNVEFQVLQSFIIILKDSNNSNK